MISFKRILGFFVLFTWGSFSGVSQDIATNVIPPSPTAAALGKYAEIPISYHTGTPQISIPIWTIDVSGYKLPINLSYHSSGVKVSENSSWVGLGWSLNAGGTLTRSVVGIADNHIEGYYINSDKIPSQNSPDSYFLSNDFYFYLSKVFSWPGAPVKYDTEPDKFFFNFNGHGGELIFDQDGEAHFFPHQKMSVLSKPGDNYWQFISQEGIKYNFGENDHKETTQAITKVNDLSVSDERFVSTWYLTSIELTNGKKITFNYEKEYYRYRSAKSYTKKVLKSRPTIVNKTDESQTTYSIKGVYLSNIEWEEGRIEFVTEPREDLLNDYFDTSKPAQKLSEIRIFNKIQPEPIKSFKLKTGYFDECTTCNTEQKYKKQRLKLEEVKEVSSSDQENPPHIFTYNERFNFQDKETGNTDHWGFAGGNGSVPEFNGLLNQAESNYYLEIENYQSPNLSAFVTDEPIYTIPFNVLGNQNKEPNEDLMKVGILEEIQYPTGGKTVLEYEPHYYTKSADNEVVTKIVEDGIDVRVDGGATQLEEIGTFTLDKSASVTFNFEMLVTCWDPNTQQEIDCSQNGAEVNFDKFRDNSIRVLNSNNEEILAVKWEFGGFGFYEDGGFNVDRGILQPDEDNYITVIDDPSDPFNNDNLITKFFPSGTYTLKVNKDPDCTTDVRGWLYYNKEIVIDPSNEQMMAGGLRIKRKTDYDEELSPVLTQSFEYDGGCLFYKPKYHSAKVDFAFSDNDVKPVGFIYTKEDYLELSSGSLNVLGSSNGSHIGYDNVTVHQQSTTNNTQTNGYVKYIYDNIPHEARFDYDPGQLKSWSGREWDPQATLTYSGIETYDGSRLMYPSPPLFRIDQNLGNIMQVQYYDNTGRMAQQTINNYELDTISTIQGLRVSQAFRGGGPNLPALNVVYLGWYEYKNSWNKLISTTTIQYNQGNGTGEVTQTETYAYDNPSHLQLTKTTTTNSNGDIIVTENKYAADFPEGSVQFGSNLLRTNHMHSQVLEQTQTLTRPNETIPVPIARSETHYANPIGFVLPEKQISYFKEESIPDLENPSTKSIQVDYKYNSNGNVQQVTRQNDNPTAYIWGYQETLPIAKVANASPEEIAYSSFESKEDKGGWNYTGSGYQDKGHTGLQSFSGTVSFSGSNLDANTHYTISCWYQGSPPLLTIGGAEGMDGEVVNGWQYRSWTIKGDTDVEISTAGLIDELRLYPEDAQMTTYTYDPLRGMTSATDPSSKTVYYHYDGFGRLQFIKDRDGNILNKYEYQYRTN